MKYIDIDKSQIPYEFNIKLSARTYTIGVNYNAECDFFTIDLYRNGVAIVLGEKLVYNNPLFSNAQYKNIPDISIVPFDLSGEADTITFDNLNETVFLYLVGE